MQYDIAGNVIKVTDPRGNSTSLDFTDVFGSPDGEARTNTAPTELSTPGQSSYGFVTKVTNALGQIGYTQYDYHIGKPVDAEDPNGVVASGFYNDTLDRPTQVIRGNQTGSTLKAQTSFSYNDGGRSISTTSDQSTFDDNVLGGTLIYDGLGRTIETHKSEGSGFIITSKKTFDALGRPLRGYNPYRTTSDSTYGYADTTYDALSRPLTVTTADGAVVQTSYLGKQVTVTDQAGKKRTSTTDALGRLMNVVEDPTTGGFNYSTSYGYDALDDLTSVTQGVQTRTVSYDSLKRLTSASNPESGAVMYTSYDGNGNLLQKKDNRNITTTYTYDVLNRVTSRSYQNDTSGTPAVAYFYDAQVLPTGAPTFSPGSSIGRLVGVTYGGGAAGTYMGYDTFGRATLSYQQTSVQNVMQSYQMGYSYDLSGAMTSETYPSGKVVNMAYDGAGRVTTVSKQGGGNYASNIAYAPQGAVASMSLGNGLLEQTTFNNRMQPTLIQLGVSTTSPQSVLGLAYSYSTAGHTDDNGNVLSQTITVGGHMLAQSYVYDQVNRLTSALESLDSVSRWTQTYGYDQAGNRTTLGKSGTDAASLPTQTIPAVSSTTNKLTGTPDPHDPAGNLIRDPITNNTFTYDGENKQVTATVGVNTSNYTYDGDGRRVKKVSGGVTTIYVYNVSAQLIAEYNDSGQPPVGGGGTSYLTTDHLGSTRVVTNSSGGVKSRHDYMPFGEQIGTNVSTRSTIDNKYDVDEGIKQRFTSKERDSESGLDYFEARYFNGGHGRFTSPDLPFVDQHTEEPQSWNLYAYGRGNPLAYVDPTGHYVFGPSVSLRERENFIQSLEKAQKAADALKDKHGADSKQYKDAQRAIDAYGRAGVANGVTIGIGQTQKGGETLVTGATGRKTADNPTGQKITVMFSPGMLSGDNTQPGLVAHEGSHVADGSAWVSSGFAAGANPTNYETELRAFHVQASISEGLGVRFTIVQGQSGPFLLTFRGWTPAIVDSRINQYMVREYHLTPEDRTRAFHRMVRVTK